MSNDLDVPVDLATCPPQTYQRPQCAVFRKTSQMWGEFSNMAGNFPIVVNGVRIRTSEALYQACRFPHLPGVQREIIGQASPMAAKMTSKAHRGQSREDFEEIRVSIMGWALRVKLACNYQAFSRILRASGDRPIVEESHRDAFWGTMSSASVSETLIGQNVLGRLLVALREQIRHQDATNLCLVEPPNIENLLLYGNRVVRISGRP